MFRSLLHTIATLAAGLALVPSFAAAEAAAVHPAFRVQVAGAPKGAPMILIPGLASDGEVWNGTVAHYCGARRCHVLTLAGFAGVAPIGEPLLQAAERQLSTYIAAQKLDHPVVIGHSLGGFLALKLAAHHPDQIGKLVIVDALPALLATRMPNATPEEMKQIAEGMRKSMLAQDAATARAGSEQAVRTMATHPQDIDRVAGWGSRSDRTTVINAMADLSGEDLREEVGRIQAPTLVLGSWVAYKEYGPKALFEQMYRDQYRKLPGVRVELAEMARHFIMFDDPAWMYDRIDHFLD